MSKVSSKTSSALVKSTTRNNNSNAKPTQGQQSKKKSKNKSNNNAALMRLTQNVCGLNDPFCVHARGCKYPDSSSTRTLPFTYRYLRTLTSDANGNCYGFWFPSYRYDPFVVAGGATGSTVTSWINRTSRGLMDCAQYRIVSAGLKISRISAPLYASGMAAIRVWGAEGTDNTSYSTIDLANYNATEAITIPYQDLNETTVIFKHSSQPPQVFYSRLSETAIFYDDTSRGFLPVSLYLSGVPASTAVVMVEEIFHYELIFADSDGMFQVATPAPAYNPVVTHAAATVSSTISSIATSGIKFVGKMIEDKAKKALASMFLGPAASSAVALLVD